MDIPWIYIERIGAAFLFGAFLGLEREYRSKPAGLRTIILITVGSCVFSLLNLTILTDTPDRIASSIVTGVGFLGAGVIFKEGINVRGLTTAATIWVAAAIGMAVGFGEFTIAIVTLLLVLIVLIILTKFESWLLEKELREYNFTFAPNQFTIDELEQFFSREKLKFKKTNFSKDHNSITVEYQFNISGEKYQHLIDFVKDNENIIRFERK